MFLNRWLHRLCSWIHSLLHPRAKENPMHHEPPRCEDQPEILHVVTCISNPAGYESRVRLYREFVKHITSFPSVKLWVIEGAHPGYLEALKDWGKKVAVVRAKYGDVGYIDGLVLHSFHGYKWHRFYDKRHKFYKNFDPNRDLIRDEQGITCWNVNNPEHNAELVKELQWYHRHRKEDARYPEYPIDTVEPAK